MHTGMPLSVFVDAHDHGSRALTKTFCWGSVGSVRGETSGSREAVTQDIATL